MQMWTVKLSQIGFGVGTRLSAPEQLRACVKWNLVDRDFFIFSNFVRQIFFQIFDDN